MVWIAGATVGAGGVSGVTFSSIPQTFTHLQVRVFGRGSVSFSDGLSAYLQANGDGASTSYAIHGLTSNGASISSQSALNSGTYSLQGALTDSNATAGTFGVAIFDLLDYTSTNKSKVIRCIGGHDRNGFGRASFGSGIYYSTSPITQLILATDGTLQEHSRVDLYGITSSQVTGA